MSDTNVSDPRPMAAEEDRVLRLAKSLAARPFQEVAILDALYSQGTDDVYHGELFSLVTEEGRKVMGSDSGIGLILDRLANAGFVALDNEDGAILLCREDDTLKGSTIRAALAMLI